MAETTTLKITIGNDAYPIVESVKDFDNSIFRDTYRSAYKILNAKLKDFKKYSNEEDHYNCNNLEQMNNIIAFLGDRGSGKSSSMLSFLHSIKGIKNLNSSKGKPCSNDNDGSSDYSIDSESKKIFHLNVIDPSMLSSNKNILQIIIGQLFISFRKHVNNNNTLLDNNSVNLKKEIYASFDKVRECLQYIESKSSSLRSVEEFISFSSAVTLRDTIENLIRNYVKYFNDSNDGVLIIPIDDMDLNTEHAYHMLEQIRKYLMLPNVVVLLSAKLDQLQDICELYFEGTMSSKANSNNLLIKTKEMAMRYITKLLPISQRIHMPDSYLYNKDTLLEVWEDDKQNNILRSEVDEDQTISQTILKLILQRTSYLFYDGKATVSYIIPSNLRDLVMLVNTLCKMSFDEEKTTKEDVNEKYRQINRTIFKNYFTSTWCSQNLTIKQYENILYLLTVPAYRFNKSVINSIIPDEGEDKGIEAIFNKNNIPYNISIGDMQYVLNKQAERSTDDENLKYIFALKAISSIRLFEAYNYYSNTLEFATENNKTIYELLNKDVKVEKLILQKSIDKYIDFEILVGRSYFCAEFNNYVPFEKTTNLSVIYRELTQDPFEKLKRIKEEVHNEIKPIYNQLYEFFILTIVSNVIPEIEGYRKDNKRISINTTIQGNPTKSLFDATYIFRKLWEIYNSVSVKAWEELCGYKWDDNVSDFISQFKKNHLKKNVSKKEFDYWDYILDKDSLILSIFSCAHSHIRTKIHSALCTRNIEVLDYIEQEFKDVKADSNSVAKLSNFFKKIADSKAMVYGSSDINYIYIQPIVEFLSDGLDKIDKKPRKILESLLSEDLRINQSNFNTLSEKFIEKVNSNLENAEISRGAKSKSLKSIFKDVFKEYIINLTIDDMAMFELQKKFNIDKNDIMQELYDTLRKLDILNDAVILSSTNTSTRN